MTVLNKLHGEKIDMPDEIEGTSNEEMLKIEASRLLKGKQQSQLADMRDTMYYAVVVFANRYDKDRFLEQIDGEVEVKGDTFVDGYELSSFMGFDIQCSASLPKPHHVKRIKIK